jgi:hypothetical protein
MGQSYTDDVSDCNDVSAPRSIPCARMGARTSTPARVARVIGVASCVEVLGDVSLAVAGVYLCAAEEGAVEFADRAGTFNCGL